MAGFLTRLQSGETGRKFDWPLHVALILSTALLLILPPIAHLYPERLSYLQHVQVKLWLIAAGAANLVAVAIAIVQLAKDRELRVPWNYFLLWIAGGWWAFFLTDWFELAAMLVTGGN